MHKAVVLMENKVNLQHNKLIYLEDSMVMYGVYNAETLEKLITTIHKMHNITSPKKDYLPVNLVLPLLGI